jgi:23S rRNA (adenine2503-C2)-methyltransferase
MISLFDQEKLEEFRHEHKIQPYRIRQVMHEVFDNAVLDFQDMSVLPKDLRTLFAEHIEIIPFGLESLKEDDETTKFLFATQDGQIFETVLMYHKSVKTGELNRMTLCISSQVGCSVGCIFCVTGKL